MGDRTAQAVPQATPLTTTGANANPGAANPARPDPRPEARDPWPETEQELRIVQASLGVSAPSDWIPSGLPQTVAASYICFAGHVTGRGSAGDPAWAGAAVKRHGHPAASVVITGAAGAGYAPGLLALREGRLRWQSVLALEQRPEVLLIDATGRDHPRRAGLALHLGAVLGIPTVGVTERPLVAEGAWPAQRRGAFEPLLLAGELVGYCVRTRSGVRPVVVHAAWRTNADVAVDVVLAATRRARTPQTLRVARHAARTARSRRRPDTTVPPSQAGR